MMRVCHLDTCPVGIATQNPVLRERYTGTPEFVETFFEYIAQEVRELLASLGLRSLDEAIGRAELLDARDALDHAKARGLDLSAIFAIPDVPGDRRCTSSQDHGLESALDQTYLPELRMALDEGRAFSAELTITNRDRTVGTLAGYELTKRFGGRGLEPGTVSLHFTGTAGQSFGAFVPRGIELELIGDANDYVGKGISGGRIIVRPSESARFAAHEQVIAGNVIGYGATSGQIFIRGRVGERFCVRNSGATAVVEGVGDHACEYMTGGRVVVLGETGRNFGAGMSGGIAFMYDPDRKLVGRVNPEMVELEALDDQDTTWLIGLLGDYAEATKSPVARRLLERPDEALVDMIKVMPRDYRRVLEASARALAEGRDVEQAIMETARG